MVDASNLVNMEIGTKPNPKLGVTNRTKLYQSTPSVVEPIFFFIFAT
jgi:hypothetical protein